MPVCWLQTRTSPHRHISNATGQQQSEQQQYQTPSSTLTSPLTLTRCTMPYCAMPRCAVLCCVAQDDEDTYDAVVDSWVTARGASLEQQVAGLRLLHACLDCWLFQYPLTGAYLGMYQGWLSCGYVECPQ